ncbi:MAG: 7-cyano-7-deazaguanine synthase [Gemmatimonadetes bacterium]|nr:7-cyano-7-deazaguanine synthase [Gemmatimonadota bacterium]
MRIVPLVSGGLDSTLVSVMAKEEGAELFPLFIDYGQLAVRNEWEACKRLHSQFGLPPVTYMDMSGFGKTISSGLTDSSLRINEDAFLPGRNLLFVLAGAAHAIDVQANSIALGLLNPADHIFPDQTKQFLEECERIIQVAMGSRILVLAPLLELSKRDVLLLASKRGITQTYSCHAGSEEPCGVCIACIEIYNAKNRR